MTIEAVFLDVANTLLYKPSLFTTIKSVLESFEIQSSVELIEERHKVLSEIVVFPDRTSKDFYFDFNRRLLLSLGIFPQDELLDKIYQGCSYLPWQSFEDNIYLSDLAIPIGILSNWDSSLPDHVATIQSFTPRWMIGSQSSALRKPDPRFFELILTATELPAERIAFVGDSPYLDIEPAHRLGMRAILIDRKGHYPSTNFRRVRDFSDLRQSLCD